MVGRAGGLCGQALPPLQCPHLHAARAAAAPAHLAGRPWRCGGGAGGGAPRPPAPRPPPPIWLAANGDVGVKRAARLADTWLINPHTALPTLERQLALFPAERPAAGPPPP